MSQNPDSLERIERAYSVLGRLSPLFAAGQSVLFLGRERLIRRTAVQRLGLGPGNRVLEVGCGTGRSFPHLIDAVGSDGRLVAFDYTREMLAAAERRCRRRGWRNVELVRGDAAELDVGELQFDGVLADFCMTVMPEPERALRRCRDVLRPGGVLCVADARLLSGAPSALNPLVRWIVQRGFGPWHPDRDIASTMERVFGNVDVQYRNWGSIYIAASRKTAA